MREERGPERGRGSPVPALFAVVRLAGPDSMDSKRELERWGSPFFYSAFPATKKNCGVETMVV